MIINFDNNKLLVNVLEAASLLSIGRSTVYKLIDAGDLKVVKLGSSARVTMDSIRALVHIRAQGSAEPMGAGAK